MSIYSVLKVIENYFILLMIYSITGWIYETILCSVLEKKFVNRGFLNGPYCPIYGWGALFDIIILGNIENPYCLFVLGALVNCTLEYITSYVMEKLFHSRWWDYSEHKFNINGRVCLLGAIVFGLFATILIKIIQPFVGEVILYIPESTLNICSGLLFIVFVTDNVITITGFIGFDEKLKELTNSVHIRTENAKKEIAKTFEEHKLKSTGELIKFLEEKKGYSLNKFDEKKQDVREKLKEFTEKTEISSAVNSVVESFTKTLSGQQERMLRAFPKLKSVKYNDMLSKLKEIRIKMKNKK